MILTNAEVVYNADSSETSEQFAERIVLAVQREMDRRQVVTALKD